MVQTCVNSMHHLRLRGDFPFKKSGKVHFAPVISLSSPLLPFSFLPLSQRSKLFYEETIFLTLETVCKKLEKADIIF
jgi:hypothetical protein